MHNPGSLFRSQCEPGCAQVPVSTSGVFRRWSLRIRSVHAYILSCVNFRLLLSFGVWFHSPRVNFLCVKTTGPEASTPWKSLAPVLTLPLWISLPELFRLPGYPPTHPPSPSPYVVLIPSPRLNFVGSSVSCMWIYQSPNRLHSSQNWGPMAPSVEIILFRCIFTMVRLVGCDNVLPL